MTAIPWDNKDHGEGMLRLVSTYKGEQVVDWFHVAWRDFDHSDSWGDSPGRTQREGYYTVCGGEFAADFGEITHWSPLPEIDEEEDT